MAGATLQPTVRSVAVLSLHTSPLAQPGTGDGGGMNVYVRELVSALASAGIRTRVFVRRWSDDLPKRVVVEPNFEVVHVPAGPTDLAKEDLPSIVGEFADGVCAELEREPADVVHANYWLSGVAGLEVKDRLRVPLVTTFHTLARVKAELGDPEPEARARAEAAVMSCAEVVVSNCDAETDDLIRHYGADPGRIEVVTPGVDHAFFSPGSQRGARAAIGVGNEHMVLFVGRIQPLKGLDVAVRALAELEDRQATLMVVGGASGAQGEQELSRIHDLVDELDVAARIRFVPPQPHHLLSTFYRAADVSIVPSRSESFGLVALEAQACGTPVVASAVGGLLTLVDPGRTGYLVEDRDPAVFAKHIDHILGDPLHARRLSTTAARRARAYTWTTSASSLRSVYARAIERDLVPCETAAA